jgi:hypothetical protein
MASTEWHWEQGSKYGIEGLKTALLLNGAAAIALMTFANTREFSSALVCTVVLFALGALFPAVAFCTAYLTQLEYGNAERPNLAGDEKDRIWRRGRCWNQVSIILLLLSMVFFVIGTVRAVVPARHANGTQTVREIFRDFAFHSGDLVALTYPSDRG